jgi:hypothetical protein
MSGAISRKRSTGERGIAQVDPTTTGGAETEFIVAKNIRAPVLEDIRYGQSLS